MTMAVVRHVVRFVHDHDVAAAVKTIVTQARTGRMGDGKILVLPCLYHSVLW